MCAGLGRPEGEPTSGAPRSTPRGAPAAWARQAYSTQTFPSAGSWPASERSNRGALPHRADGSASAQTLRLHDTGPTPYRSRADGSPRHPRCARPRLRRDTRGAPTHTAALATPSAIAPRGADRRPSRQTYLRGPTSTAALASLAGGRSSGRVSRQGTRGGPDPHRSAGSR